MSSHPQCPLATPGEQAIGYWLHEGRAREAREERDATAEAERWNADHQVGTRVRYWPGVRAGDGHTGVTRSVAQVLGGHTAVVWVSNWASCLALSHVEALHE